MNPRHQQGSPARRMGASGRGQLCNRVSSSTRSPQAHPKLLSIAVRTQEYAPKAIRVGVKRFKRKRASMGGAREDHFGPINLTSPWGVIAAPELRTFRSNISSGLPARNRCAKMDGSYQSATRFPLVDCLSFCSRRTDNCIWIEAPKRGVVLGGSSLFCEQNHRTAPLHQHATIRLPTPRHCMRGGPGRTSPARAGCEPFSSPSASHSSDQGAAAGVLLTL